MITHNTLDLMVYLDAILVSYDRFNNRKDNPIVQEMYDRFHNNLKIEIGSKYIKVVANGAVHSFIVKEDTPKFKAGDILMAKSWKAPATNFARGNIFTRNYPTLSWTGP